MLVKTRLARATTWTSIAVLLTAGGWANAQSADPVRDDQSRFDLSFSLGGSQSDNITRVPDDEESGSIGLAGVKLQYRENTRRIDADVNVDAAYQHYFDNNFDDGVIGGGNANLTFGIVPDVFEWIAEENFGQVASDPFSAVTPDNRENINLFTTGPDYMLHFGSDTSLKLSARYSDTNYEKSEFDGNQTGGSISFAHRISAAGRVSLNVEGAKVSFDNEILNRDYDRRAAFVRYEIEGARTTMTADAGYTSIDVDGGNKSDGVLARLSLTRRMSPSSTLNFSFASQFSSAGDLFRGNQNLDGVSTDPSRVNGSGDPFENRIASLGYDFARNRTSLGASVQYSKEEYETLTLLDRTFTSWNAYIGRELSSRMQVRLYARLERQKFDNVDFDDDTLRVGGYMNWMLSRDFTLRVQYELFDRDSSEPTTEYAENVASLFLMWAPLGRR